jgi:hypothetical protein
VALFMSLFCLLLMPITGSWEWYPEMTTHCYNTQETGGSAQPQDPACPSASNVPCPVPSSRQASPGSLHPM